MSAYSDLVIATGVTGYYREGEASGTVANDSGTAGNGTYVNAPTLGVAGAIVNDTDTAVTFASASSQSVSLPFIGAIGAGDFTFACWFKSSSTNLTQTAIAEYSNTGSVLLCGLRTSNSTPMTFRMVNAASTAFTITGVTNVCDGNWHFVVGVLSGTTMTLYVDALGEGGTATFSGTKPTLNATRLGAGFGGGITNNYLNGSQDESVIYKGAWTAAQVMAIYEVGRSLLFPFPLIGQYGSLI